MRGKSKTISFWPNLVPEDRKIISLLLSHSAAVFLRVSTITNLCLWWEREPDTNCQKFYIFCTIAKVRQLLEFWDWEWLIFASAGWNWRFREGYLYCQCCNASESHTLQLTTRDQQEHTLYYIQSQRQRSLQYIRHFKPGKFSRVFYLRDNGLNREHKTREHKTCEKLSLMVFIIGKFAHSKFVTCNL
jgi:hypothetical protein